MKNAEHCMKPTKRDLAFLKLCARFSWLGRCCFLLATRLAVYAGVSRCEELVDKRQSSGTLNSE